MDPIPDPIRAAAVRDINAEAAAHAVTVAMAGAAHAAEDIAVGLGGPLHAGAAAAAAQRFARFVDGAALAFQAFADAHNDIHRHQLGQLPTDYLHDLLNPDEDHPGVGELDLPDDRLGDPDVDVAEHAGAYEHF